ncbi:hypothetical protein J3458_003584 [Metarhizium acridum]|uniref:uncharacterized protein n=1 Tax=Metarhizium acridum TaxID=92637 RepID=UPI001C6BD319|nr:hypothetical protein J3458_003584 [Metarhizium acridum]
MEWWIGKADYQLIGWPSSDKCCGIWRLVGVCPDLSLKCHPLLVLLIDSRKERVIQYYRQLNACLSLAKRLPPPASPREVVYSPPFGDGESQAPKIFRPINAIHSLGRALSAYHASMTLT